MSPDVLWPHLDVLVVHRQTISCYYVVNETKAVSFDYKPRGGELAPQLGQGHLTVQMRLAYGKDELHLETGSLPHDDHRLVLPQISLTSISTKTSQ